MKKIFLLLFVLSLSGCGLRAEPVVVEKPLVQGEAESLIEMTVDFGDRQATASAELSDGATALSVLEKMAGDEAWIVEKQVFSFGSLVVSIDGYENGPESSWLYFVNGEAGSVAADEMKLKPGDGLVWRYESFQGDEG